jgi:hypothetical protein
MIEVSDWLSKTGTILAIFLFFRFLTAARQNKIKNIKKQLPNSAVIRVDVSRMISFILSPLNIS